MSESFKVTNTQARRITIAGQDVDPFKTSKPIQVTKPDGTVDEEATASLVAAVKASPPYRAKWLVEGPVVPPPPVPMAKPDTLVGLEDAKALAYVRTETDLATLASWAEAENRGNSRKDILDAIGTRAGMIAGK